ncbi:MAG: PPC domain-containing protein [Spirochaetaceae bacterium]|jgi:hypothetical protein|nr:PPC domain-containing protein [Spirochaetaceae bacterium]
MLKKLITVTALFVFFLPAFLYGQQQQPPKPASLAELDQFLVETAIRLDLRLRGLPRESNGQMSRVGVGSFTLADELVALSDIWKNGVLDTLTNVQNRTYALRDTASPPNEYLLSGIILEAGNTVRVTTRIIKTADSSLIASWNSDLAKTPFISELLEAADASSSARRDRFETDSQGNPVPVETGGAAISRTIHNGDDRDFFLVRLEEGGMVVAETGGNMDTMMEIYGESGDMITSNDDGGGGENARCVFFAEGGKSYTAMVRGYSSETGSYTFRVSREDIPDLSWEPNDSREQAHPITPGRLRAAFFPAEETDWYALEIPAEGARLIVSTESDSDTWLTLYDSEGQLLAEDDDGGHDNNARISMYLPAGTVYIKANLYGAGSSAAFYTLETRIQFPATRDEWEPDNSASRAKDIETGVPQTRNFSDSDDEDWVKFTVTERGRYTIRARGVSGPELDTFIELFDSEMDSIDEDDDGGERYDSRLSANLAPGVYYIKVSTLDDDPGDDYTLSVSAE